MMAVTAGLALSLLLLGLLVLLLLDWRGCRADGG